MRKYGDATKILFFDRFLEEVDSPADRDTTGKALDAPSTVIDARQRGGQLFRSIIAGELVLHISRRFDRELIRIHQDFEVGDGFMQQEATSKADAECVHMLATTELQITQSNS